MPLIDISPRTSSRVSSAEGTRRAYRDDQPETKELKLDELRDLARKNLETMVSTAERLQTYGKATNELDEAIRQTRAALGLH